MSEEKAAVDIDLGANGGTVRLKNAARFLDWVDREAQNWTWLTGLQDGGKFASVPSTVSNRFQSLRGVTPRVLSEQLPVEQLAISLEQVYRGAPPGLFYSAGETGQAILSIKDQFGEEDAAIAYAILIGLVQPDMKDPRDIRLLNMVAFPHLIDPQARASASRASYRAILNRGEQLLQKQEDFLESTEDDWNSLLATVKNDASDGFKRALHRYSQARRRGLKRSNQAIASIQATEAVFAEGMRLKASVKYWSDKSESHATNEGTQRTSLFWFVGWSTLGAFTVFSVAMILMLEMAGANPVNFIDLNAESDKALPATPFLVVAAGLGTILTALFWAARIFVRNYLTERHLKIDAEERKVMTMTYLALINEQGAVAEEDRLVILNALFRPTAASGGVGDDGPQAIALPALLAKLVDQRRLG